MKPTQLFLRCYAEKVGDQWQAFCLDLSLAAQGDTFAEVKDRLDAMVAEYVYDALVGEDREYAHQLLTRRAPLRDWLKYYWYCVLSRAGAIHEEARRLFTSLVPLDPPRATAMRNGETPAAYLQGGQDHRYQPHRSEPI